MSKVQNSMFDVNNDGKINIDDLLDGIAKASPLLVMLTASISFILLIVFESDYYGTVLAQRWNPSAALVAGISVAVVREFARAVLLIMTFADFRKGNARGAWLGLLISLSLVAYDIFSASPISNVWSGSHTGKVGMIVVDLLVFLVSLSFVLEFRLVLSGKSNRREKTNTNTTSKTGVIDLQAQIDHYKNMVDEYASANKILMDRVTEKKDAPLNFEDIELDAFSKNGNGVY